MTNLNRRVFVSSAAAAAALGLTSARASAASRKDGDLLIGFYSGFFAHPANAGANDADMRFLSERGFRMGPTVPANAKNVSAIADFFASLKKYGMSAGIRPAFKYGNPQMWHDDEAAQRLAELKPIDGVPFDIYLGHEVYEWANRDMRLLMNRICKQALPKTRTRMYFARFALQREHAGANHPHGGNWDDYAIRGAGECDILHFAFGRLGQPLEKLFATYEESRRFLAQMAPGRLIYTHINVDEEALNAPSGKADLKTIVQYLRGHGCNVLLLRTITPGGAKVRPPNTMIDTLAAASF